MPSATRLTVPVAVTPAPMPSDPVLTIETEVPPSSAPTTRSRLAASLMLKPPVALNGPTLAIWLPVPASETAPVTVLLLCSVVAKTDPAAACVTSPALVDRSSAPTGSSALPSVAAPSAMPAAPFIVTVAAPVMLVAGRAASCSAVISPLLTPEAPFSVIGPASVVSVRAPAVIAKPWSMVSPVPPVSDSVWLPRFSVLAVP